MKKRIASAITALALILAMLPATVMAAEVATYRVTDQAGFEAAMEKAGDGDIIKVDSSFVLNNRKGNSDSLVIDKAVTIQGSPNAILTLRYCGIVLGADVTFENITLGFACQERNAIMANGHTLTLNNVQKHSGNCDIHLFCGGLTGGTQTVTQGAHGQVIIQGNTNLGASNIYAGSISTDGMPNQFTKPATITIDSTAKGGNINQIYATGALETYVSPDNWFDTENEIAPPTANAQNFPVSGVVTINLYSTFAKNVDGNTGVADNYAKMVYSGSTYLNESLILTNMGGLDVKSGKLVLRAGSSFAGENADVTVGAGSTLGLNNLGQAPVIGSFTGGGNLFLGQNQKLTITGAVSGTTTVGIGDIFNNYSQKLPIEGHTYINAAQSQKETFTLAPYATRPDMRLVYQKGGTWMATAKQISIEIPVPAANAGLIYTGQEQVGVSEGEGYTLSGDYKGTDAGTYSATVTLCAGYVWDDGSKDSKTVTWSIGKAAGSAAPVGLTGVAPSAQTLNNGKITGTTADMEYASDSAFTNPTNCGAGETGGLVSGTYYVRVKGDSNREAGAAAIITVPVGGLGIVPPANDPFAGIYTMLLLMSLMLGLITPDMLPFL